MMTEQQRIDAERLAEVQALLELKVDRSGECWLWTGYTQPNGYGWINRRGLKIAAHRAALLITGVEVPSGMDVCHRCDVRNCIKPEHLYVGTRRQNMADCTARARHNKPHGETHWRSKLSSEQVLAIRQRRASGETLQSIANAFQVNNSTVLRISRGEYRKEVA